MTSREADRRSSSVSFALLQPKPKITVTGDLHDCLRTGELTAIDHNPLMRLTPARSAVRAGRVQRHGGANKSLQRLLVNLLALVKVDGTPGVAIEAGVEEA